MGPLWYAIVVISVFYIVWRAMVLQPSDIIDQRQAKYHYVRAGVACTFLQIVFMFVLYASNLAIGPLLPIVCFATWTVTLTIILANSTAHRFMRRVAAVVIIATPLILLLYPGGASRFLSDADRFSATIAHGVSTLKVSDPPAMPESPAVADGSHSGTLPTNEVQTASAENPTTFSQMRVSHFLRAVFLFINAFLVSQYFGTMWYFGYQERSKQAAKAALEQDAASQIVLFVSGAVSLWLAFVFLGFDTISLSIFSGFVVVGASYVFKDLLTNFISGALLLWMKSIRVGDVISINKSGVGRVVGITMRYLIVEDRNDIEYLIPYSQLANATIENWSKGKQQVRLKLSISVAYGTPLDKVKEIMSSVCFEVSRVLCDPLPSPLITDTGDSAIHFELRFRIADPENGISNVKSEVYERLLKRFEAAKIEIPYPQREIRIRSDGKEPGAAQLN